MKSENVETKRRMQKNMAEALQAKRTKEISEATGVAASIISKIKSGHCFCGLPIAEKIANCLGISIDEFVGNDVEEKITYADFIRFLDYAMTLQFAEIRKEGEEYSVTFDGHAAELLKEFYEVWNATMKIRSDVGVMLYKAWLEHTERQEDGVMGKPKEK